jgi:hypothetical protein
MEQNSVVAVVDLENKRADLGFHLSLEITDKWNPKVHLYHHDFLIKSALLSDKAAKRLFIVEAVELGAIKSRLASSLNISRQSIDNYIEIKKHFGLEGLIHSYSPSKSKNLSR